MFDFTTVVGIDEEHYEEWLIARESFERLAPRVLNRLLFLVDEEFWSSEVLKELSQSAKQYLMVPVPPSDAPQRARMLTALTTMPHEHIDTPWFLKLDTDAVAVGDIRIPQAVVSGDMVLAAPKWGYTKPATMMTTLAEWTLLIPEFYGQERRLPEYRVDGLKAKYPRIISYFCWVNTAWSKEINERYLPDGKLPVPSQDTFLWHMTRIREEPALRLSGPDRDWCVHKTGLDRIRAAVESTRAL